MATAVLDWPWGAAASAWMGPPGRDARERIKTTYRDHYMQPDLVLYDAREWRSLMMNYTSALGATNSEAMVQMLVTVLSRDATRKDPADDRTILAASLRHKHSPEHFAEMYRTICVHWTELGAGSIGPLVALFDKGPAQTRLLPYALGALGISFTGTPVPATPDMLGDAEVWTVEQLSELDQSAWNTELLQENPLDALLEYCTASQLRLIDLFNCVDKDKSGKLDHGEMEMALVTLKIPLDREDVRQMIKALDQDGDGEIDYKELVAGRREAVTRNRMVKKASFATIARLPTEAKRLRPSSSSSRNTDPDAIIEEMPGKGEGSDEVAVLTAQPGSDEAAVLTVQPPRPAALQLDPAAFTDLVLHCHYMTRP